MYLSNSQPTFFNFKRQGGEKVYHVPTSLPILHIRKLVKAGLGQQKKQDKTDREGDNKNKKRKRGKEDDDTPTRKGINQQRNYSRA